MSRKKKENVKVDKITVGWCFQVYTNENYGVSNGQQDPVLASSEFCKRVEAIIL